MTFTTDGKTATNNSSLLIGASCVALATLVPVALYQTGVTSRLPDPPLDVFDSERITSSKSAHLLGIPDSLLGLASFGVTLGLALAAKRNSTANRLLGAKLIADASVAAFNASRQILSFGKLCSWCTGTALAAGVMTCAGLGSIRATVTQTTHKAKTLCDKPRKDFVGNWDGMPESAPRHRPR